MTRDQFKAAREVLGPSVGEMATLLGVDARSVRRLEDGTRAVTLPMARLVQALLDGWRPR